MPPHEEFSLLLFVWRLHWTDDPVNPSSAPETSLPLRDGTATLLKAHNDPEPLEKANNVSAELPEKRGTEEKQELKPGVTGRTIGSWR